MSVRYTKAEALNVLKGQIDPQYDVSRRVHLDQPIPDEAMPSLIQLDAEIKRLRLVRDRVSVKPDDWTIDKNDLDSGNIV